MESSNKVSEKSSKFISLIKEHFSGEMTGRRVAVWGAALASEEIDPVMTQIIDWLILSHANVAIHDDSAICQIRNRFGTGAEYPPRQWDAIHNADVLLVGSPAGRYCSIDAGRLCWAMNERTLFDVCGAVVRDSLKYSDVSLYTEAKPEGELLKERRSRPRGVWSSPSDRESPLGDAIEAKSKYTT